MMENKFTPRAEEALRLAQEAAEDMGHGYVGSEHLLLGLLREEEGIAHRVLEENGLTDEMVCDILHRSVGTGVSGAAPSQGLTPRAKSAVELAVSEAARTGAGYIGTEHLLMGLLREGNNMALRILRTVELCREPRTMSELAAEVDAEFPNEVSVYTAAQLVQLLERAGGVERVEDEAPADAGEPLVDADGFMVVTPAPPVRYVATQAGLDAAEARVSEAAIIAMLQEEPQYLPLYERIFSMCSREGGCPVKELDAAIDHDPLCVEPRRFCGYFLGKLERLGALEWNTVWTVSALGTQVMASDIFSRN